MLKNIGNVNAATSFFRIIASNLATRNGDMGAVLGSKPSAAMVTVAIRAAEVGIAIVRNVTAGNSNAAAFGHDAATKSVHAIKRAITGDYAAGHRDCRPIGIYTAATRSAVAGNYAVRNVKSRLVDRYSCTGTIVLTITSTNVTTVHIDGRLILRVHQASDMVVFLLCEHAALKTEMTAVDVDELQVFIATACHDGTINIDAMFEKRLGCLGCVCCTRGRLGHIVGKVRRNAIGIVTQLCFYTIIVAI